MSNKFNIDNNINKDNNNSEWKTKLKKQKMRIMFYSNNSSIHCRNFVSFPVSGSDYNP